MAEITTFGTATDGRAVQRITLRAGDLTLRLLTWGSVVQDLQLAGADWPLTLGSPDLAAYEGPMDYFGAIVGPVANRIGGAQAVIAGRLCRFPANEGTTLLHGGPTGTQKRHWDLVTAGADHATLRLTLPDGTDGFPGNRVITASWRLEAPARMMLHLSATSDAPTLMNLANHSYWNLDGGGTVAGHSLSVAADHYLPTVRNLPTGECRAVAGAFDLRVARPFDLTAGYDHNVCLAPAPRTLTEVAVLTGARGLRLRLATTEPGLQVYDGTHLTGGGFPGHGGAAYGPHQALALEPQRWPDAPNHPAFPPIALEPGETYRQTTLWSFDRP